MVKDGLCRQVDIRVDEPVQSPNFLGRETRLRRLSLFGVDRRQGLYQAGDTREVEVAQHSVRPISNDVIFHLGLGREGGRTGRVVPAVIVFSYQLGDQVVRRDRVSGIVYLACWIIGTNFLKQAAYLVTLAGRVARSRRRGYNLPQIPAEN